MFGTGRNVSQIVVPGTGSVQKLNLSPDGRRLAFVGGGRLFVRDLDSDQESYIEGTEGAGTPFWSPNGRWIAFTAGGKLKKVAAAGGGMPQVLCDINTNIAGAWSTTGDILIGQVGDGLFHVRETGGVATRVTVPDKLLGETRHLSPQFLPDGRQFIFVAASGKPDGNILYVGSLSGEKRVAIMPVTAEAVYAQGHLLFIQNRQIMAQAFDPVSLRRSGSAYQVGGPVTTAPAAAAAIQIAAFSAAPHTDSPGAIVSTRPVQNPAGITIVRNWMK